jgi:hypothetical protein
MENHYHPELDDDELDAAMQVNRRNLSTAQVLKFESYRLGDGLANARHGGYAATLYPCLDGDYRRV